MKVPRNISGEQLIEALGKFGYEKTKQFGSCVVLVRTTHQGFKHLIPGPNEALMKERTLDRILEMACEHLKVSKDDLLKKTVKRMCRLLRRET